LRTIVADLISIKNLLVNEPVMDKINDFMHWKCEYFDVMKRFTGEKVLQLPELVENLSLNEEKKFLLYSAVRPVNIKRFTYNLCQHVSFDRDDPSFNHCVDVHNVAGAGFACTDPPYTNTIPHLRAFCAQNKIFNRLLTAVLGLEIVIHLRRWETAGNVCRAAVVNHKGVVDDMHKRALFAMISVKVLAQLQGGVSASAERENDCEEEHSAIASLEKLSLDVLSSTYWPRQDYNYALDAIMFLFKKYYTSNLDTSAVYSANVGVSLDAVCRCENFTCTCPQPDRAFAVPNLFRLTASRHCLFYRMGDKLRSRTPFVNFETVDYEPCFLEYMYSCINRKYYRTLFKNYFNVQVAFGDSPPPIDDDTIGYDKDFEDVIISNL
jgi:hypothetical protein